MQIGDYFRCPDGAIFRLLEINETDQGIFRDIDLGIDVPIDLRVAEHRLLNVSELKDEQWQTLNDLLIEIANDLPGGSQGEVVEVMAA